MYNNLFDKIKPEESLRRKIEERIDANMKTKKSFPIKITVLAACLVLALSAGALAAYRFLSAGQAARELGDNKLAVSFEDGQAMDAAAQEDPYRATLLGVCSGENLSDFGQTGEDIFPERTYAVMAIERTDGREMTLDDGITVSPLIQGLDPMRYNIFSLEGSMTGKIIDGTLYRIVECDSIECLADRQIYLAVYDGLAPNSAYSMDADTGEISPKADYDGVNMLLELNLDPEKADPVKAQALIDRVEERMGGEAYDETDEAPKLTAKGEDEKIILTETGSEDEKNFIVEYQNNK